MVFIAVFIARCEQNDAKEERASRNAYQIGMLVSMFFAMPFLYFWVAKTAVFCYYNL